MKRQKFSKSAVLYGDYPKCPLLFGSKLSLASAEYWIHFTARFGDFKLRPS